MLFRDILHKRIQENLNFIQILIGPRQVGKTTAIKKILENWSGSKIFETADTPSVADGSWIELHWQRARQLDGPVLLVFDEIQKVPNWSEKIKILFDQDRSSRKLRVVLLGSASLTIQKGLTESLVGRYEIIPAYHWDYMESKAAFDWDLNTFLKYGGYPAGAELVNDPTRWQSFISSSVLEPVLSSDIMGLAEINKPALLRQTCALCLKYPAQELSLNKILGSLQDKGNVTTIRHYLDLLEGAFLIKTLSKYSGAAHIAKASIPKIIPLAPALVHAFNDPIKINNDLDWRGRVFEATVGAALNRLGGELYYWREANKEVDFILVFRDQIHAIEVKSGRPNIRQHGLMTFHKKYPSAKMHIVDPQNFLEVINSFE